MIITGCDVGSQRPQRVERRLMTVGQFLFHILPNELHGHMAGPFDHHLHIVPPGDPGELPEGFQLGELRGVVGVGD